MEKYLPPSVVSLIILSDRSQHLVSGYFAPCERILNISRIILFFYLKLANSFFHCFLSFSSSSKPLKYISDF